MSYNSEIYRILSDKTSGSMQLAFMILKFIIENPDSEVFPWDIIRRTFSDMPIIVKVADRLENSEAVVDEAKDILSEIDLSSKLLASKTHSRIKNFKKLMTISQSGTLESYFKYAQDNHISYEIYVPVCSPENDGLLFAKKLSRLGHNVHLISDISIALYAQNVDCIMTGADQFDDTHFINRTGSDILVNIHQVYNIPYYVCTTKHKKVDSVSITNDSEYQELYGICYHTPTFTKIELSNITELVTEDSDD